jgi:uncharacterized protein YndB with AHSA1/START domain
MPSMTTTKNAAARTTTTTTTSTTTATNSTDFECTLPLAAPADAVRAALRTPEAISSWWGPTTGSAEPGGALRVASRSGSTMLRLGVEPDDAGRVVWSVEEAPLTTEWLGTTISFDVRESGGKDDGATSGGAVLHFRHRGLTPACDCFDMCQAGWTDALGRLVSYVETGAVAYARDSFQSTLPVAAPPAAVLAALRTADAVSSWWGPATGSADVGDTLVVSFLGGRQRIVMDVQRPPFENRVVWSVRETPLTPEWDGTTIYFDVVAEDAASKGSVLSFRHEGLTPELECFDMCHEGWTHYLASLVSYVETGTGQPERRG